METANEDFELKIPQCSWIENKSILAVDCANILVSPFETFSLITLKIKTENDIHQFRYLLDLRSPKVSFVNNKHRNESYLFSKAKSNCVFTCFLEKNQIKINMLRIEPDLSLKLVHSLALHEMGNFVFTYFMSRSIESGFLVES